MADAPRPGSLTPCPSPGGRGEIRGADAPDRTEPTLPELLDDLLAKLPAAIQAAAIDSMPAKAAARNVVDLIRREWGGRQLYIPRGDAYDIELMRRVIGEEWNGTPASTAELCRRFQISDRHLRRLHAEYKTRLNGKLF